MKSNPTIQAFRRDRDYDGSPQWFLDYSDVATSQGYRSEAKALQQMAACARFRRAVEWALVVVSVAVVIALVLQ